MKKHFDSLQPLEKRVVVGVGVVFFVVLNFWFVFPHFSDWGNVQGRMSRAQQNLAKFQAGIAEKPAIEKLIRELGEEGLNVEPQDQGNQFGRAVQKQAGESGVAILTTSKLQVRTNQFFLELTQNVGVQSREQELVDFLYNLGSTNSLIRVRDMSLHPDPSRQQLALNVKLVASFQKAAPRPAAPLRVAANTSASNK